MRNTLIILLFIISFAAIAGNKVDKTKEAKAREWLKNQPLEFIENKGQFMRTDGKAADEVLFKTSFGGFDIYITDKGLSYVFVKMEEVEQSEIPKAERFGNGRDEKGLYKQKFGEREEEENKNISYYRLDMNLEGANISKSNIIKENESKQGHYNYFYAHCPKGIYDVKGYGKITIKNVYKGIDWVIYTNSNSKEHPLKYDFVVHPGADYKDIKIKFLNAQSTSLLDKDTKLKIETIAGNIEEGNLYSYQSNSNNEISSKYIIDKDSIISFEIADYDTTKTLVIDPLVWATYYGGSRGDPFISLCVDSQDNLFVLGYTSSLDFPVFQLNGAFWQSTNNVIGNNSFNMVLLKFNNQCQRLWSTFYGGSIIDRPFSLSADNQDNIFIVGCTNSTNFPVQQLAGAYWQANNAGGYDLFILKFNNQGIRQWATYYGGSADEGGIFTNISISICIDSFNNVFISGVTNSVNFPIQQLVGAFWQSTNMGTGFSLYILKFSNQGIRQWATYFGNVVSNGFICHDSQNNIYITGTTVNNSSGLLTQQLTGAYFQSGTAGDFDTFILKFSNNGVLLWSTYYGGTFKDIGLSVCCDTLDNLYVLGYTYSTDLPTLQLMGAYWQPTFGGGYDFFILKFNNLGVRQWATYYGGSTTDASWGGGKLINSDNFNNIFITGRIFSTNFPIQQQTTEYWQPFLNSATALGYCDAFILKFNDHGVRQWATYYGGNFSDMGMGTCNDHSNSVYIVGSSGSSNNYTVNYGNGAYYDNTLNDISSNGYGDGIVLKIDDCNIISPTSIQANKNNLCINDTSFITLTAIGGMGDTLKWYKGSCGQTYVGTNSPITIPVPAQTTTYYARWESTCDTSACDSITINIVTSIVNNINPVLCNGQSYYVGNHVYNTSGLYHDTLTSVFGCDSIINTNLSIGVNNFDTINPVICQGNIFHIGNHNYFLSGIYVDTLLNISGCDSIVTTNLTVNPVKFISQNKIICQRQSYQVGSHFYTTTGVYIDTLVALNGCDSIITTNLTVNPNSSKTLNPIICQGESFDIGMHSYTASGIYKDTLLNYMGCDSIITINLTVVPFPVVNLGQDTSYCFGHTLVLDATNQYSTYLWQDNSTNPTFKVSKEGVYWVTVSVNSNCVVSDTIEIGYEDCNNPVLYIPNSFTPNLDGLNEVFKIETLLNFSEFKMYIYNRWGQQIFECGDKNIGWDGKFMGNEVPIGVYVYLIRATLKDTNISFERNGKVTLIR